MELNTEELIAALRFYANPSNHHAQPGAGNAAQCDQGNLARAVLLGKPAFVPAYGQPLESWPQPNKSDPET